MVVSSAYYLCIGMRYFDFIYYAFLLMCIVVLHLCEKCSCLKKDITDANLRVVGWEFVKN